MCKFIQSICLLVMVVAILCMENAENTAFAVAIIATVIWLVCKFHLIQVEIRKAQDAKYRKMRRDCIKR